MNQPTEGITHGPEPRYRSAGLGRFAIARRCVVSVTFLVLIVLGLYEVHRQTTAPQPPPDAVRRLALYSLIQQLTR